MKKIAILLIFGIILSYLPLFALGNCSETHHLKKTTLDCGSFFHCPIILAQDYKNFNLYLIGLITFINPVRNLIEIPHSIFHPPEV